MGRVLGSTREANCLLLSVVVVVDADRIKTQILRSVHQGGITARPLGAWKVDQQDMLMLLGGRCRVSASGEFVSISTILSVVGYIAGNSAEEICWWWFEACQVRNLRICSGVGAVRALGHAPVWLGERAAIGGAGACCDLISIDHLTGEALAAIIVTADLRTEGRRIAREIVGSATDG